MIKKAKKSTRRKRVKRRSVLSAVAYIQSSFNNTIVTITDRSGAVLCWSSSGVVGFKGTRKGTPFAAQMVAEDVAKKSQTFGVQDISVRVNGPGFGRDAAVRGLAAFGLKVKDIADVTPIPHNGCRPPKRRRV